MIVVSHRVNTREELRQTSGELGCEIDIRNHGKNLVVEHDPFLNGGLTLEKWLTEFDHRFLIVNVKEEGLEPEVFRILNEFDVENYFILDESIPYIMKYCKAGESRYALRVSELEDEDTAIAVYKNLVPQYVSPNWIWADCFSGQPITKTSYSKLVKCGFWSVF